MERVGGRYGKMEGHCSTGQSPQWAVVPIEEEEEQEQEGEGEDQEKMERGSRKRSSSVQSEKMERVGGRYGKMEGHCSTGQSPQWAVVPMEEEE